MHCVDAHDDAHDNAHDEQPPEARHANPGPSATKQRDAMPACPSAKKCASAASAFVTFYFTYDTLYVIRTLCIDQPIALCLTIA
jgi:hypothetical protein